MNVWGNTIPEPNSGCLLWLGAVHCNGYGQYTHKRRSYLAHRLAWQEANGRPVPAGMLVCHKCDVRLCVNPDHLFLGTHAENIADMVAKGRQGRGSRHSQAKLTVSQVLAIRADGRSQRAIAMDYGVTQTQIGMIQRRRHWGHI